MRVTDVLAEAFPNAKLIMSDKDKGLESTRLQANQLANGHEVLRRERGAETLAGAGAAAGAAAGAGARYRGSQALHLLRRASFGGRDLV